MNKAPPQIFHRSRALAKWNRARSRTSAGGARYLADTLADDALDRLEFMKVEPGKALVVSNGPNSLTSGLKAQGWKLESAALGTFDEEHPTPPESSDLFVHLLGLGMVNDLPGALIHARNALKHSGLFIAAFPGAGSVPKLRSIVLDADADKPASRIHPQVDNRAGTALLERAGFARQVVDSFTLNVRYSSLETMICDLRDHGLTSSLASPTPLPDRAWLDRAHRAFDARREDDGKVTETFEMLVLTGWR